MMALDCLVTTFFGDAEYAFALRCAEIEELQRRRDAGLAVIYRRLWMDEWFIQDIVEVLRLGLIGGGMAPVQAKALVDMYAGKVPWWSNGDPASPLAVARVVIVASMNGVPPPKDGDAEKKSPLADGSTSPASEASS